MEKSRMKLHPFYEVVANAEKHMAMGARIYQQWNCCHCGAKQTMDVEDTFYKQGCCEECGELTNIEQDGCNFMLTVGARMG